MYGMNSVVLVGNLGADPEVRSTQEGKPVCNLRIAVTSPPFDGKGEDVTGWHDVVVWGKPAEAVGRLGRGDAVIVIGRTQTRSYDKDGVKHYRTEIVAEHIGPKLFGGESFKSAPRGGDAREDDRGSERNRDDRRDSRGGGGNDYPRGGGQSRNGGSSGRFR